MNGDLCDLAKKYSEGLLSDNEFLYQRAKIIHHIANGSASNEEETSSRALIVLNNPNRESRDTWLSRILDKLARQKSELVVLLGILITAWVWLNFENFTDSTVNETALSPASSLTPEASASQLMRLTQQMLAQNQWDVQHVVNWGAHWTNIQPQTKQQLAGLTWFQQFVSELEQQVNQHTPLAARLDHEPVSHTQTPADAQTLLMLTGLLNLIKQPAPSTSTPSTEGVLLTSDASTVSDTSGVGPEQKANASLVQPPQQAPNKPEMAELDSVIERLATAVDVGHPVNSGDVSGDAMEAESALVQTAQLDNQATAQAVEQTIPKKPAIKNYYELLKQNQAVITTPTNALEHADDPEMSKTSADRAEHSAFQALPTNPVQDSEGLQDTALSAPTYETPTTSELQSIVTNFISAYEAGKLEDFPDLFTTNAQTNDQKNLRGITQEYSDLFSKTTTRRLSIDNLDWNISDKKVSGTGQLLAVIKSDPDKAPHTYHGEIYFDFEKSQDKMLISRMIYNIRE